MNPTAIKMWYGQITTGAGAMVLAPTLLALLAHQITLAEAIPAIAAGIVGLVWPENKPLAAAVQGAMTQAVAAAPAAIGSADAIIGAYRAGLTHGMSLAPPVIAVPTPAAGRAA